jgi:hypothetical protein
MTRVSPLVRAACLLACLAAGPAAAHARDVDVTLQGSRGSMTRQNQIARDLRYSFLRTPAQVQAYVDHGHLVPLPGNGDYAVIAGYPYARPVVRSFIERLAADYRDSCGERLVVTSLTRPSTRQPRNASPLSVHPAGMAVDLRVSARSECRAWLMRELLVLEERGVLDATLERKPPHFHVAVFPLAYEAYEHGIVADSVVAESIRLLEEAVAARDSSEAAATLAAETGIEAAPRPPALVRIAAWLARVVLPISV